MSLKTLQIEIPSDLSSILDESDQALVGHVKLALAMLLYQQEKITIGKAAELANLTRYEFEMVLSQNKIPISNLSFDEISADIEKLKEQ